MNICIIKAGSAIVTQNDNMLDLNAIQGICLQIIELSKSGWKVILVSSGAVACGKGAVETGRNSHDKSNYSNSILAALGQSKLIYYYSSLLNTSNSNIDVGQILVTRKSISNSENYINLKKTITGMLEKNIIPIINENDALGLSEINFIDNDQLASIIAVMVSAKKCILLSEVGAVFTKNPKLHDDALRISEIDIDDNRVVIDDSNSSKGGMKSKLDVFNMMGMFGIKCTLIGKDDICKLHDIIENNLSIGTRLKHIDVKGSTRVKDWLSTSAIPKGIVLISPLGADVLSGRTDRDEESNLYSIGICGFLGHFDKGEVVSVRDEQLNLVGVGVSKCSSEDLKQKKYGRVFIRKNNFIRLEKYPFIDLDMLNIKLTLKKLRKRLFESDDEKFTITPLAGDIDKSKTTLDDESIVISRSDVKDLIGLFRDAKKRFSVSFDEWLIYSALEGVYEKYDQ